MCYVLLGWALKRHTVSQLMPIWQQQGPHERNLHQSQQRQHHLCRHQVTQIRILIKLQNKRTTEQEKTKANVKRKRKPI